MPAFPQPPMFTPPRADRPGRPAALRWALCGLALGIAALLAVEASDLLFGENLHAVVPGRIYRTAQLSGDQLERLVRRHGIRTVVNLRGSCPSLPWYQGEARTAHRLDLSLEDVGFSAGRLPSTASIRALLEVLDRSEYPLVLHCQRGIDRTGLAAVVARLLYTDASLVEGRRSLGLRYLHLPFARTGHLDRFFDLYEEWLATRGLEHTPAVFRRWASQEYCPAECRASLELISPDHGPLHVPPGQPTALPLRCRNLSIRPWRLRPEGNAGIQAIAYLFPEGKVGQTLGSAGLFRAEVPPGGHVDLTLALPALEPGRYTVWVDLLDPQHAAFYQAGSAPLEVEVLVP